MSSIHDIFRAPPTKTALGRYQVLSPLAGVRVSPLCLGAMNFGKAWESYMGDISKDEAFKIMDTFFEAGGNFIDTANNYQNGESEQWIGDWMAARQNRQEIVLATKFTTKSRNTAPILINYVGNHKKSLHISVEQSLKRLQTDYIDVLYVHWWDYTTSVEELMQSLNALVVSGKVLYLGVSDTPAWVVSQANTYAKDHGLAQFVVYQGRWNAAQRELEREILPMCRTLGLSVAPWNVLHAGKFARLPAQADGQKGRGGEKLGEQDQKVFDALLKVGEEVKGTVAQIALAYVIHKFPNTTPIVGGRKASYITDNIKALDIKLTEAHIKAIEAAGNFEPGFPHDFIGGGVVPDYDHLIPGMGGKINRIRPL